ncbi:hypothetical protein EZS27_021023 [termite gut metagenome]|uniref:Uncharacterized protein n=1 Tax=termite gut metagenome TaxID=433724 RepID=A0A5J4RB92_9ZZZZ
MDDIHYDAIFGKLSEISTKLDSIQATSKTKENQPVHQMVNQSVSQEEIESIVKTQATIVGKYMEYTHQVQTEHHNKLLTSIGGVKKQIEALPVPEKISFEPIMKLFPKPKKVTICGFEFLRTSVIITILILAFFFSLVLNIKQMDDYRTLKNGHNLQIEYMQKMQTREKEDNKKSK